MYKLHKTTVFTKKFPNRINSTDSNKKNIGIEKIALFNGLREMDFDSEDIKKMARSHQRPKYYQKGSKNASPGFEFVISAGENFCPDWKTDFMDKRNWERYFKDTKRFFEKKYGADIILNTAIHWDETTPHMHMLIAGIVPLSEKEKQKPKNAGKKMEV